MLEFTVNKAQPVGVEFLYEVEKQVLYVYLILNLHSILRKGVLG